MTPTVLGRPSRDEVREMAEHVDHEMSRLLWIGEMLSRAELLLPVTVVSALRVAYCGHARALLEFFHDGRSDKRPNGGDRQKRKGDYDIWLGDYTGTFDAHSWSTDHENRLLDADKLLGHLSTGRLGRGGLPEWGDREDRVWVRSVIEQVKTDVSVAGRWDEFPQTEPSCAGSPGP